MIKVPEKWTFVVKFKFTARLNYRCGGLIIRLSHYNESAILQLYTRLRNKQLAANIFLLGSVTIDRHETNITRHSYKVYHPWCGVTCIFHMQNKFCVQIHHKTPLTHIRIWCLSILFRNGLDINCCNFRRILSQNNESLSWPRYMMQCWARTKFVQQMAFCRNVLWNSEIIFKDYSRYHWGKYKLGDCYIY